LSTKLFIPLEQVKKGLNLSLSETVRDHDVYHYILSAQQTAEGLMRREMDGERDRTEYYSGNAQRIIVLNQRPTRSITSINVDNTHVFDSDTLLDSDDYTLVDGESGFLSRKVDTLNLTNDGDNWPRGTKNIKIVYKGGWIAEKTVVSSASPADHTIADALDSYNQTFYLFIHTTGTFSSSGSITVTGEDENGDSYTETITPYSTDMEAGNSTLSFSLGKFTKITGVNSSNLSGGNVRVTAVSTPHDLRLAIQLLAMHFYRIDQFNQLNLTTRSATGESETIDIEDYPDAAVKILDRYRDVEF